MTNHTKSKATNRNRTTTGNKQEYRYILHVKTTVTHHIAQKKEMKQEKKYRPTQLNKT